LHRYRKSKSLKDRLAVISKNKTNKKKEKQKLSKNKQLLSKYYCPHILLFNTLHRGEGALGVSNESLTPHPNPQRGEETFSLFVKSLPRGRAVCLFLV